jgi:hypothetical protein
LYKYGILIIILALLTTSSTLLCYASTLSLEAPPPLGLPMNGTSVNLTADDQDRDISIDPYDDLPANGTQIMSTVLATDVDINEFPPVGVSVLIQNDTITVTNHTITLSSE